MISIKIYQTGSLHLQIYVLVDLENMTFIRPVRKKGTKEYIGGRVQKFLI